MEDSLNLNKRPCWDSICTPFASRANPWMAGLRYLLSFCVKLTQYASIALLCFQLMLSILLQNQISAAMA